MNYEQVHSSNKGQTLVATRGNRRSFFTYLVLLTFSSSHFRYTFCIYTVEMTFYFSTETLQTFLCFFLLSIFMYLAAYKTQETDLRGNESINIVCVVKKGLFYVHQCIYCKARIHFSEHRKLLNNKPRYNISRGN